MWDLQAIVSNNNYVAVQAMMANDELKAAENPLPEVWPLAWLERRLKVGPPVLSEVVNGLVDIEYIEKFLNLIREFLPEHEADILSKPRNQRVLRFCYLFDRQYFDLGVTNPGFELYSLLDRLPVQLMGLSYEVYHNIDLRPGYILLMSLVPYPYEGDDRDQEDDTIPFDPFEPMAGLAKAPKWKPRQSDINWLRDLVSSLSIGGTWCAPMGFEITKIDENHLELKQAVNTPEVRDTIQRTVLIGETVGITIKVNSGHTADEKLESGARIPLIEKVAEMVGMDLAKSIPPNGWDNKQLHQMTDKSPYAGVGEFADWALANTGLTLLDSNYEHCDYQEGVSEPSFIWSRTNVEHLANQWSKVKNVRKKIDRIVEWLEGRPEVRFGELLDFLLNNAKKLPATDERRLYDPLEHWCQLETFEEEDYEEEDS